ncbi:aspartyl-phosphate phosphatase Spo0E family protein [Paenibacillus sp.]|uniref:aspartyl-phosphate phosphatase Spo0E family protein n=1 Tax=Paenibacillus sp. TaxID=58172 RepID=UPI0028124E29|nr:aspartyl-phosphate phosphatase Spo0E family protein [Paenibacillus sp.]
MTVADKMERLRATMIQAHGALGALTHPDVVAISQQLDDVVMEYYRYDLARKRAASTMDYK